MNSALGISLTRDHRVRIDWIAALLILLVLLLAAGYLVRERRLRYVEVDRITLRHHQAAEAVLTTKMGHTERILRKINQDVELVSSLPEVRHIDIRARNPLLSQVVAGKVPPSEAEKTVEKIHAALSTGLPVYEIYCVLSGFHPDLTGNDPQGERPYFEVGRPEKISGKLPTTPYEAIEYAWLAQAVKTMEEQSRELSRDEIGRMPKMVSPMMVLRQDAIPVPWSVNAIDGTIPATTNERHGFIVAMPFYRDSGEFAGLVAVVFQRRDIGLGMAGASGGALRGRFVLERTDTKMGLTEPEGRTLRNMPLDGPDFIASDLSRDFPGWRLYYHWDQSDMKAEVGETLAIYRSKMWIEIGMIAVVVAILGVLWRMALMNAKLRQKQVELKEVSALMAQAPDAIIVLDLEGRVRVWNPAAERMYGIPVAEARGQRMKDLVLSRAIGKVPTLEEIVAEGKWIGDLEYTSETTTLMVETHWSVIRDAEGQPKGFFVVDYDTTEKTIYEFQLRRAQRMENIGALASGVAHDLNNALTPVIVGMQMLDKMHGEMERKALQKTILSSAQRGTAMVRQILSFVRGTQGEDAPIQIPHLVEEMVKIVRDTFPKAVSIESRLEADLPPVNGNATELHQVLLNLCVNGRDAMMPKGGGLILSATKAALTLREVTGPGREGILPGEFLVLSVADTGEGIPAHVLPHIFDPLFTTKEPGKGTGLGLSTVSAIVKRMGGFITVRSEPGQGTCFSIHLPALMEVDIEEKKSEEVTELPLGSGQRILLVDDDNTVRRLSKVMLENYGYRVVTATNGLEAVSLYGQQEEKDEPIDLVISDVDMPYMGGPEVAAILHKKNAELPVILISGSDLTEEQVAGVGRESLGFLIKPYTVEGLIREVGRHVQAVAPQQQLSSAAEI